MNRPIITLVLALMAPTAFAVNGTQKPTPSKPVMELVATEKSLSFVERMKEELTGTNQTETLQSYLNSLLKVNAIYNKKTLGEKPALFYRIQFNNEGKLQVVRNAMNGQGQQMAIRSLSVYGLSHELESDCSWREQLCWMLYPGAEHAQKESRRWLEISYAPEAMSELVNGMGLLIKELQK